MKFGEMTDRRGIVAALIAALLFGASTPLAKVFSPRVEPVLLAGLLYLGSGLGLGAYALIRSRNRSSRSREAALTRRDTPWLAAAIFIGGVVGPALLMWGLAGTPASSASLLLNLEGVLTALLAWFVFRENFNGRIALGMALIAAGGGILSWMGRPELEVPWRPLAIIGACLAWAVDNNLTRKVSAGDPMQIAMLKGLVAGTVNAALGLSMGAALPPLPHILAIAIIGCLGYGVSLMLFILALRHLGTARTGAYFSTAPFVGAVVSILLLRDQATLGLGIAALLMLAGVWLHVTEHHQHRHEHEPLEHDHLHTHDEHHKHAHDAGQSAEEPHSHWHRHEAILHSHPHFPDIHHRHSH